MTTPTIRAITEEDIEAFRNTLDVVARERKYLCFLEAPPLEKVEAFIRSTIQNGNPQFVAIDENDALVGWCDVLRCEHPGTEHTGRLGMGVLPGFRGQGLGTRLIDVTIKRAFYMGIQRIELEVFSSNVKAKSLYEKVGFQVEGIQRQARILDGKAEDLIMMGLLKHEFHPEKSGNLPKTK